MGFHSFQGFGRWETSGPESKFLVYWGASAWLSFSSICRRKYQFVHRSTCEGRCWFKWLAVCQWEHSLRLQLQVWAPSNYESSSKSRRCQCSNLKLWFILVQAHTLSSTSMILWQPLMKLSRTHWSDGFLRTDLGNGQIRIVLQSVRD